MKKKNYSQLGNQHLISLSNNNILRKHLSPRSATHRAFPRSKEPTMTRRAARRTIWLRERWLRKEQQQISRKLVSWVLAIPLNFKNKSQCLKESIQNNRDLRTLFKTLWHHSIQSELLLESTPSGACSGSLHRQPGPLNRDYRTCRWWERAQCLVRGPWETRFHLKYHLTVVN